mmetsp:Transcript_4224/g.13576  ORF Transcript_4224/g.13576 Transcript_4224/m.13576 type:complete len:212 (-) Transcript_4224:815-1450(-)
MQSSSLLLVASGCCLSSLTLDSLLQPRKSVPHTGVRRRLRPPRTDLHCANPPGCSSQSRQSRWAPLCWDARFARSRTGLCFGFGYLASNRFCPSTRQRTSPSQRLGRRSLRAAALHGSRQPACCLTLLPCKAGVAQFCSVQSSPWHYCAPVWQLSFYTSTQHLPLAILPTAAQSPRSRCRCFLSSGWPISLGQRLSLRLSWRSPPPFTLGY